MASLPNQAFDVFQGTLLKEISAENDKLRAENKRLQPVHALLQTFELNLHYKMIKLRLDQGTKVHDKDLGSIWKINIDVGGDKFKPCPLLGLDGETKIVKQDAESHGTTSDTISIPTLHMSRSNLLVGSFSFLNNKIAPTILIKPGEKFILVLPLSHQVCLTGEINNVGPAGIDLIYSGKFVQQWISDSMDRIFNGNNGKGGGHAKTPMTDIANATVTFKAINLRLTYELQNTRSVCFTQEQKDRENVYLKPVEEPQPSDYLRKSIATTAGGFFQQALVENRKLKLVQKRYSKARELFQTVEFRHPSGSFYFTLDKLIDTAVERSEGDFFIFAVNDFDGNTTGYENSLISVNDLASDVQVFLSGIPIHHPFGPMYAGRPSLSDEHLGLGLFFSKVVRIDGSLQVEGVSARDEQAAIRANMENLLQSLMPGSLGSYSSSFKLRVQAVAFPCDFVNERMKIIKND